MRSSAVSLAFGLVTVIALSAQVSSQRGNLVHIPVRGARGRLSDRIHAQHRGAPARYHLWHANAKAASGYGSDGDYDDGSTYSYDDSYGDEYYDDYSSGDYSTGGYGESGDNYGDSYSASTPSYDDYSEDYYGDSYSTSTPYGNDYYDSGYGDSYSTSTPSNDDYYGDDHYGDDYYGDDYGSDYGDSYSTSTPSHDDYYGDDGYSETPYTTPTPSHSSDYGYDYNRGKSEEPVEIKAGSSAFYWYGEIGVGTPQQKMTVAFDISSSLSWVRKSGGCPSSGYSSFASDKSSETPDIGCNGFDASQSKTFKGDGHEVQVDTQDYGSFTGHFYNDVINLGGLKAQTQFAKVYPDQFPQDYPFDGALGLGLPSVSSANDKVTPWFHSILKSKSGCSSPIYGIYPATPKHGAASSTSTSHTNKRHYEDDSYYEAPEHKLVFCGLDLSYYPGLNDSSNIESFVRQKGLSVTKSNDGFWQIPFLGLSDGKEDYFEPWEQSYSIKKNKQPPQAIYDTNSIQIRLPHKQLAKVHKRLGAKSCSDGLCEIDCSVSKKGPTFTFSFGSAADFKNYHPPAATTPSSPSSGEYGSGGGDCEKTYDQYVALCGVNTKVGTEEYKGCMKQANAWYKICQVQTSYSGSAGSSSGGSTDYSETSCKATYDQYIALCGVNTADGTDEREACVDMAESWYTICKAHTSRRLKQRSAYKIPEYQIKFPPSTYVIKDESGKCYSAFTDFGCATTTTYEDDYYKRRARRSDDGYYQCDEPKDLVVIGSTFFQNLPVSFFLGSQVPQQQDEYRLSKRFIPTGYDGMSMPECQGSPADGSCYVYLP
ncbi:aspartic peptidase domain-containing protein [Cladochytrium replicatum]|nr:aspartic peptidase domain-containing protein [Cladochytrium replicatum]